MTLPTTEAKGVRWPSRPSKPAIRSFAGRMVDSTSTRLRHKSLVFMRFAVMFV